MSLFNIENNRFQIINVPFNFGVSSTFKPPRKYNLVENLSFDLDLSETFSIFFAEKLIERTELFFKRVVNWKYLEIMFGKFYDVLCWNFLLTILIGCINDFFFCSVINLVFATTTAFLDIFNIVTSIFLITFNRDRIQVFKIEDKIKIKNIYIDIKIFDQGQDIEIESTCFKHS